MVAIFLPVLLSPVAFILGRKKGIQLVTWFSFGVLAISTCFLLAPILSNGNDNPVYEESYSWSQFGNFGLRLDGLSIPFAIIIIILCTCTCSIFQAIHVAQDPGGCRRTIWRTSF